MQTLQMIQSIKTLNRRGFILKSLTAGGAFMVMVSALTSSANAEDICDRKVILQGKGKLAIVDGHGAIEWEMPWGGIHDIHQTENGWIWVQDRMQKVVAIDPDQKKVVWEYNAAKENGAEGTRIEVHAFQPLAGNRLMVAESGMKRILEIDTQSGEMIRNTPIVVDHPNAHTDTRLVRTLSNGHYLACHESDGKVREYDPENGKVVWEYEVPMFGKEARGGHGPEAFGNRLFGAIRLENGNTLIATGNGHSVLEVTPCKEIVWSVTQDELPGIRLAWVTTLEVLPNGHYVIGNCHAGPGQPQLIELEPESKKVVWQLEAYDTFGNDVSNSLILGPEKATIR